MHYRKSQVSYIPLRQIVAMGLILVGVSLTIIGPAAFTNQIRVVQAACGGQNLYAGSYYQLPDDGSHPDFEQVLQSLRDVPGQFQPTLVNGLPVPTAPNPPGDNTSIRQFDWYTPQYQIFSRLDNNPLAFSNDNTPGTTPYFGPSTLPAASTALPTTQDLFATHWHANLVAPPGGLSIPYAFALDDAGWVYLDGQLQIDHGGIHPPATFNGTFVIPAGTHVIDIFYADRHTRNAVTNFQLGNLGALLTCGSPNLSLVKSVQPSGLVNPGDLITYTIQIANTGNFTATNTLVRDTTPANTGYVSASAAGLVSTPAPGGSGEVVWNVGTLLPNQSTTVSFTVQVNANTPPALAISNAALGSSDESGGIIFKSNGVSSLVNASAVLAIDKTSNPPPNTSVNIGDQVTYTLTVSNPGNVATGSVAVDDPIPPGAVFVSANPVPQSTQNSRVRWLLPPLNPGGSTTLSLTVRIINRPANGLLQNQANASSGSATAGSPVVAHNIADAADTSINKLIQSFDNPLVVGSLITYTLQASNAGPSPANGTVVTDTIPAGTQFVSSTPPPDIISGSDYTWNQFGTLAPGTTATVTVTLRVVTLSANFQNRAQVQSNTPEIEPANNTSVADVPGNNAPVDVQVTKSGPPVIAPNQVFIYTLVVSTVNGGDNIVVSDTLPPGLTLVPEQTSPPALGSGPALSWNLGTMAPNSSRTILLAVRATGVTPGNGISNSASVTSGTGPTRTTGTSGPVATQVGNNSNLSISKAAASTQFTPGGQVNFVITVRNNAATPSGVVTVTDSLLPGFTLVTSNPIATSTQQNGAIQTIFWRITSVPGNSTSTINMTVQVPANYAGTSISNAASLDTETPNSDPTLVSPPVSIPLINLSANLVVNKSSFVTSIRRGQVIAYTITVVNSGPIEAKDVVVQDPLPAGLTFVSAVPAPTAQNPLSWNLGNIAGNNGQATITLLVQLSPNFGGSSISNGASVTSLTANSNQGNNTSIRTLPIAAPPASATPAITAFSAATATPAQITTTIAQTPAATPALTETVAVDTPVATTEEAFATPTQEAATPVVEITVVPGTLPNLPNTGSNNPPPAQAPWQDLAVFLSLLPGLCLIASGVALLLVRRKKRE